MPLAINNETVCIIAEAGRGALAGPLCFVGCILGHKTHHIVWHSAKEIDEFGISICIRRSLEQIKSALRADRYIFVGHNTFGVEMIETLATTKVSLSDVKAAIKFAKANRFRAMQALNAEFLRYGFASNLGYHTDMHLGMIKKHGVCEIHRQSFVAKRLKCNGL